MRKRTSIQQIEQPSQIAINTSQQVPLISIKQKLKPTKSTPRLFLPKIPSYIHSVCSPGMQSIDQFESFLHKMLSEEHNSIYYLKKRNKLRENFEKRKEQMGKKQQIEKQNLKKKHIHLLSEKLKQLTGQLQVEQKKLEIEYQLNDQMKKQYDKIFESMQMRLHYTDKRDQNAQTEAVEINTEEEKVEEVKKEKKPAGYYKRKFKIIAYCVYFSLAFPKYSQICRQLRRRYFKQEIIAKDVLRNQAQEYFKFLVGLKLNNQHRSKQRAKRHSKQEPITLDFQQLDNLGQLRKFSINLSTISELVLYLLTNLRDKLKKGELSELLKVLSLYLMNRSFTTDNIYLSDELYRLKIDKNNQLRVSPQYEKQLLLNFVISKLTCFKYLTQNKNSGKLLSRRNSKITKEGLSKQVIKVLLLCGLYLFKKTNDVNCNLKVEEQVKKKGNAQLLDSSIPVPMQDLELQEDMQVFGIETSKKRISIQRAVSLNILNIPGLKYVKMDKCQDLVKLVSENSRYETQINDLLIQIRELLHVDCKQHQINHLKEIKESTLKYTHYLTNPIEVDIKIPAKLPKQQQRIDKIVPLMIEARKEVRPQHQQYKFSSAKSVQTASGTQKSVPQSKNSQEKRSMTNSSKRLSSKQNSNSSKTISHRQTKSGEININFQQDSLSSIKKTPFAVVELSKDQRKILRKKQTRVSDVSIKELKNSNKM